MPGSSTAVSYAAAHPASGKSSRKKLAVSSSGTAVETSKQCDGYGVLFAAPSLRDKRLISALLKEATTMKPLAAILIVFGVGIVIWGAFGFTTREKVVDIGPIHASKDKQHNVPYGPVAGAVLALGGVVLLVKSKG
jgi:hypothetical protein